MIGEIERRIRASGPNPGRKPKNVGRAPALNCRRFPCWTNWPLENWLRSMEGPADVVFTTERPGWSFQLPESTGGRLMPVCQSIYVAKVDAYSTRRRPPGAEASGMAHSRRGM